MRYIDFDGVILDTEPLLFEKWRQLPNHKLRPETEKIKYIQNSNWEYIVNNANIINDSVYYLKNMDPNKSFILTKIHSLENEGFAKIKWARNNKIKQSIILVPYMLEKTDMVDAEGNDLIDDCLKNLYKWIDNKGKPFFFDLDNDNIDSWGKPNYKKIN